MPRTYEEQLDCEDWDFDDLAERVRTLRSDAAELHDILGLALDDRVLPAHQLLMATSGMISGLDDVLGDLGKTLDETAAREAIAQAAAL